eukprot:1152118-Pelagomonas_calceolata.AAC.6
MAHTEPIFGSLKQRGKRAARSLRVSPAPAIRNLRAYVDVLVHFQWGSMRASLAASSRGASVWRVGEGASVHLWQPQAEGQACGTVLKNNAGLGHYGPACMSGHSVSGGITNDWDLARAEVKRVQERAIVCRSSQ